MIDNRIKEYVATEVKTNVALQNKLGTAFCKWIKNTQERTVEIGMRKIFGDYENKVKETIEVDSVVLTISVEARFFIAMKEIIKSITWDERKFGIFLDENPSKNNDNLNIMYDHNYLWSESAYVKITWLPEHILKLKVPHFAPRNIENILLMKQTKNADGQKVPLFRSINKIKSNGGMYFLVTTKVLLQEAEEFASELFTKANETPELRNDESLDNPNKFSITLTQKNNHEAGSEISDITKAKQQIVKVDEDKPAVQKQQNSMSNIGNVKERKVTIQAQRRGPQKKRKL